MIAHMLLLLAKADHTEAELVVNKDCPVEFLYFWPEDPEDTRQWLSKIVRVGDMKLKNLHNYLINGPTKVPSKVVQDIQSPVKLDLSLKIHDIITGTMPFNILFGSYVLTAHVMVFGIKC